MDWDKANFQKINQRKAKSKRWETRDKKDTKEVRSQRKPPTTFQKEGAQKVE